MKSQSQGPMNGKAEVMKAVVVRRIQPEYSELHFDWDLGTEVVGHTACYSHVPIWRVLKLRHSVHMYVHTRSCATRLLDRLSEIQCWFR